jgi:hypothetical protein
MLSVHRKAVCLVALGISAEGCDIELNVAIEDLGQLLGEFRTILQSLFGREFPDIEISPGALVVPSVTNF